MPVIGMLLFSPVACRSMSFIAISLALLCVFDIGFSLEFIFAARPVARRTVWVDLRIDRLIAEVLRAVVVVRAAVDVLRLHRLTPTLFDVKPPALFVRVLAGESARVFAESTWLSTILLPW